MTLTPSPINRAVRDLRSALSETQQEFANRLGVAVRTIARYEATREPAREMLSRLSTLAREAGRLDISDIFANETAHSVGGTAPVARTEEESAWAACLFHVLRNRRLLTHHGDHLSTTLDSLLANFEALVDQMRKENRTLDGEIETDLEQCRLFRERASRDGRLRTILHLLEDENAARILEDLWNAIYDADDLQPVGKEIYALLEVLVEESALTPSDRNSRRIERALVRLDTRLGDSSVREKWYAQRSRLFQFFGIEEDENL